jgi:uracil-DNA glycosylase family 4
MENCDGCNLHCSRTQIVYPTRCEPNRILAIGEAPGIEEDDCGQGFVGKAGKQLDALLFEHNLHRGRDYGVANIVRCHPPQDRPPRRDEKDACIPYLVKTIIEFHPRVLLLVGKTAASEFMGRGTLYDHIKKASDSPILDINRSKMTLRKTIEKLDTAHFINGIIIVPMPHTSPLAWNRKAKDGRAWKDIGIEQIGYASGLLMTAGPSPDR